MEINFLAKGCLSLFHHSIDMRTAVNLSISCRKNMFLLENFNKNTFFLHEIDKLTVVLMSIKWLNKIERPLAGVGRYSFHKFKFDCNFFTFSFRLWKNLSRVDKCSVYFHSQHFGNGPANLKITKQPFIPTWSLPLAGWRLLASACSASNIDHISPRFAP